MEQKEASAYVYILPEHELYDNFTSFWENLENCTRMCISDGTASYEVLCAVEKDYLSRILIKVSKNHHRFHRYIVQDLIRKFVAI